MHGRGWAAPALTGPGRLRAEAHSGRRPSEARARQSPVPEEGLDRGDLTARGLRLYSRLAVSKPMARATAVVRRLWRTGLDSAIPTPHSRSRPIRATLRDGGAAMGVLRADGSPSARDSRLRVAGRAAAPRASRTGCSATLVRSETSAFNRAALRCGERCAGGCASASEKVFRNRSRKGLFFGRNRLQYASHGFRARRAGDTTNLTQQHDSAADGVPPMRRKRWAQLRRPSMQVECWVLCLGLIESPSSRGFVSGRTMTRDLRGQSFRVPWTAVD